MPETTELIVGSEPWTLTVPADRAVHVRRANVAAPTASAAELVREALEKPFKFEPLRRRSRPMIASPLFLTRGCRTSRRCSRSYSGTLNRPGCRQPR